MKRTQDSDLAHLFEKLSEIKPPLYELGLPNLKTRIEMKFFTIQPL